MMPLDWRVATPGLALVIASVAVGATGESPAPSLLCRPLTGQEAPEIDGSLADPAWREASWYSDFRQSVPDLGQPATEATSVAFLSDDHNIYVAIRCDDSRPELIRANKLRHRDDPASDDHVQVIFDTYRDQVRGTVFIVNPLGAREEGLVNGHDKYNWSWDEVWDAKASLTGTGWQAEMRIPLRLLRYGSEPEQTWGVNVVRVIRREQEEVYVSPPPPPFDISSLDYAAALTGLQLAARQRNLQIIPYALGGVVRETGGEPGDESSRSIHEVGFDLKYSLTSDLTLDATYNTDFAQVESDDEQVNLTRFSLFFPEKREFFLDNAQLFSFGDFGGGGGHAPDVSAFFSRRIGLHRGATVPIDLGVRLSGKVGKQDIGVLTIGTSAVDELGLDPAWYNVVRVRRDLGRRTYVGAIVTDSRRDGFRSTTVGVDAEWYITRTLSLRGYYLGVDDNQEGDDGSARNVALDLTTDPWGFLFGFTEVDEGFAPDLGYVRRDGYRKVDGTVRYSFRPGKWGVRRVSIRTFDNWYDSLEHGVRESSRLNLTLEVELESGDELELRADRNFERLFEPFELDEGLVFPVGDYTYDTAEISYSSDDSRRLGLGAWGTFGEFFDGDSTQIGGEAWWVLSKHVRVSGAYETYDFSTPHGEGDWNLWGVRVSYTHSATLSASVYAQHNSSNGATAVNFRVRWILPNDSDLFLVVNERREELSGLPVMRGRDAAVKVNYRFFL